MRLRVTRRSLLELTALQALTKGGLYGALERMQPAEEAFASPPARRSPEQHLLGGLRVARMGLGFPGFVPPLHHQIVTAQLKVRESRRDLAMAQIALNETLTKLDQQYPATPAGLGVTIAWGMPYFRRYVWTLARNHLPVDVEASRRRGRQLFSLSDAARFPSDPPSLVLEDNDVAVLLRSDSLAHIADAAKKIFDDLAELFEITSIRKGFAGPAVVRERAIAANLTGARRIPATAPLLFGFSSTRPASQGPGQIANIETLGLTRRTEYFAHGTHMHLSHLFEEIGRWYELDVPAQTERMVGHTVAMSTRANRLERDTIGSNGLRYRKGTSITQRADFNTIDNPFFWSLHPKRDSLRQSAAAGLHFVIFTPTSSVFERLRLAMDDRAADGSQLRPNRNNERFNRFIRATHRQNFLVPPRNNRSLPLVELLK